jgi:hypothetical protein
MVGPKKKLISPLRCCCIHACADGIAPSGCAVTTLPFLQRQLVTLGLASLRPDNDFGLRNLHGEMKYHDILRNNNPLIKSMEKGTRKIFNFCVSSKLNRTRPDRRARASYPNQLFSHAWRLQPQKANPSRAPPLSMFFHSKAANVVADITRAPKFQREESETSLLRRL